MESIKWIEVGESLGEDNINENDNDLHGWSRYFGSRRERALVSTTSTNIQPVEATDRGKKKYDSSRYWIEAGESVDEDNANGSTTCRGY